MFLVLHWPRGDADVSWLLGKKPGSVFTRDLGPGRRVVGSFEGEGAYRLRVENDPEAMRERLHERDAPTRVSAVPYAVCPPNLTSIREALRGAIAGRGDIGEVTEASRAAPRALAATLGPFLVRWPRLEEEADRLGLRAVYVAAGPAVEACVARFEAEMPLAEFLQRVLVLAYHLSVGEHWHRWLDDGQVRGLIEASRGWLASCPSRAEVVRSLTGGQRDLRDAFDVALDGEASGRPDLHGLRHRVLVDLVPPDARSVVEIGAGVGLLTALVAEAAPEARILAMDVSRVDLARLRKRVPGAQTRQGPATHPYVELGELGPSVLLACEVIEHLGRHERAQLVEWIRDVWRPELLLLTTPNRGANASLGVPPGEMRHRDHRVEFDAAQLDREVVRPLEKAYVVRLVPMIEGAAEQPSFVVAATRTAPASPPELGRVLRARHLYAPEHVAELGVTVTEEEVADGLSNVAWRSNRQSIFYLAPTVPPAGAEEGSGLLEDPRWALGYLRARGVTLAFEQEKLMGSRGHVLAFRDRDVARGMGFEHPLVINTRAGLPLFERGDATLDRFHAALAPHLTRDVVAFDAEVLPWYLKGAALIRHAFRGPAEAALLDLRAAGLPADGPERFLETLSWFDAPTVPEIVGFAMLAEADVARGHFRDVRLWLDEPVGAQVARLEQLLGGAEGFRVCPTLPVDLLDEGACEASCARWARHTGPVGRGEGFVYRPQATTARPDGGRVQPALKVRGARYLELLYGWGYADDLGKLAGRPLGKKRAAALVEDALARRVLQTFFRQHRPAHERAVAAFLGADGAYAASLDPTL